MSISLKEIVKKLDKMHVLQRYYIYKAATNNGLYRGQLTILEFIRKNEKCTQKMLAEHLGVSPPSIATSIKRMQKAGLLDKVQDQKDLRNNQLVLTDKGKDISEKCRAEFNKIDKQMFQGFDEHECEILCGYIDRITDNLLTDGLPKEMTHAFIKKEWHKNKYKGRK